MCEENKGVVLFGIKTKKLQWSLFRDKVPRDSFVKKIKAFFGNIMHLINK